MKRSQDIDRLMKKKKRDNWHPINVGTSEGPLYQIEKEGLSLEIDRTKPKAMYTKCVYFETQSKFTANLVARALNQAKELRRYLPAADFIRHLEDYVPRKDNK